MRQLYKVSQENWLWEKVSCLLLFWSDWQQGLLFYFTESLTYSLTPHAFKEYLYIWIISANEMQTNGSLGMKPKTNEQRAGLQGGKYCSRNRLLWEYRGKKRMTLSLFHFLPISRYYTIAIQVEKALCWPNTNPIL